MYELSNIIDVLDPTSGEAVLNVTEQWLGTYIKTAHRDDLATLTLWAVATHLANETWTSPRLLLDSPAPGSGKTTTLDHLQRLTYKAVQAASLSSPSLLARLLEKEPRTVLVDEVDRTLDPKNEGSKELLAVLNSGYRRGASRPVLVQRKDENGVTEWQPVEMSTYGPVALAGNSPNLPDDTRSRCITVLLLPDLDGTVADSDWQHIEEDALALQAHITAWADLVRGQVEADQINYTNETYTDPATDEQRTLAGLRGRNRERWAPLLKVARAAGGEWPDRAKRLILNDLDQQSDDREAGLTRVPRHVQLLRDIATGWPTDDTTGAPQPFTPTADLLRRISWQAPDYWGSTADRGELTAQGLGRMLAHKFSIRSQRVTTGDRERGYYLTDFYQAFSSFGVNQPGANSSG
ncbi:DUF3631 domain-containing protein [Corynebacterium sanguinis]